ncbi:MAG: hypothetical protein J6M31_07740 [Bacteroidales bacterium]|nr:hypothetical protein [Bacteroidales bacterium]
MKKLLVLLSLLLLSVSAQSQGILKRFDAPEKGHTTFIPKGCRSLGITGSYRQLKVGGETANDGFSILSFLNVGDGSVRMWEVAPNFQYFIADDLSLGVRLDYNGYNVDTDLKLDLRDILDDDSNFQITSRHMVHHAWGASTYVRKYLSFFGSKLFGVFGEARLYGNYGITNSFPYDKDGVAKEHKNRNSRGLQAGLKLGAGGAFRFRDGSTIFLCIPFAQIGFNYTWQKKERGVDSQGAVLTNDARMSSFNIARNIDFLSLQVGYSRFINRPKKHR